MSKPNLQLTRLTPELRYMYPYDIARAYDPKSRYATEAYSVIPKFNNSRLTGLASGIFISMCVGYLFIKSRRVPISGDLSQQQHFVPSKVSSGVAFKQIKDQ